MPLPVFLTARAQRDVEEAYEWWATHRSAEQARRWRDKCVEAIDSLPNKYSQCRLSPESNDSPIELRQFIFGLSRRPTHRAVFTVRPEMILVLRIQHLAQDNLTLEEL